MGRRRSLLVPAGLVLLTALAGGVMATRGISTGPAVRAITVGMNPSAVAVDQQTGRVFVANTGDLSVSVLDAADGRVLRTVAVAGRPDALAVDTRSGRVFVVTATIDGHGRISDFDSRTGALLRTVAVPNSAGAIAVDRRAGRVFVVNALDDSVSVLDTAGGKLLRTVAVGFDRTIGYHPCALAVDERTGRVFVADQTNNSVSVLDARTGTLLRVVLMGRPPVYGVDTHDVAVDEQTGRVFVARAAGVTVLDARDGAVLHTVTIKAGPYAGGVVVDEHSGCVFVDHGNSVRLLDARTGAVRGSMSHSLMSYWNGSWYTTSAAMDERTGQLFIASGGTDVFGKAIPSGTSHVDVLDGRTGQLLRTIPVAGLVVTENSAIAVDTRIGRAFLIGTSSAGAPDAWGWVPPWLRGWLPWLQRPKGHAGSADGTVTMIEGL